MNQKWGKGTKLAMRVCLGLLLALLLLIGVCAINASIVRVRRADVMIADLPPAFDGVTLLYAADVDLCGLNTAGKSGVLFQQLQSLKPDILLLGGDYLSSSLIETLSRPSDTQDIPSERLDERASFFQYIKQFDAPLGRYAIASPDDRPWDDLSDEMINCDIRPLINDRVELRVGGDAMWLAGVCEQSSNLNAAGRAFRSDDCVIVAAYSPTVVPVLLTSEAADSGPWADLTLCGHTHGGQLRLFGRNLLDLDASEQRFLYGWNHDSGYPILTSSGIGCESVNLRFGSQPEVWLITLHVQ